MATRPTEYITWTDGAPSKVIEPTSGQKLSGWLGGQAPPNEYMNWCLYILDLWTQWLDQVTYSPNGVALITGTTTAAAPVKTYFCNVTGGAFSVVLPAAASNKGTSFNIKNTTFGSGNVVTMGRTGTDLLEGATTDTVAAGDSKTWKSDGVSNWYLVGAE